MNWKPHYEISEGSHALLSPSNHHWLRYSEDKLITVINNKKQKQRGTELHALAEQCINLNVKLPKNGQTLSSFINDAIGYKMESEQLLYHDESCYGTADAISFKRNFLRIHDLKTGVTKASMEQLYIYAALFCLEYKKSPNNITIELRIYQNNEVIIDRPDPIDIMDIMGTIKNHCEYIRDMELNK